MNKSYIVGGWYKPPFEIYINYRGIRMISINRREFFMRLIITVLHELFHFFQFFFIARCNMEYYHTVRYHKISEQQAYFYVDNFLGKFFGLSEGYRYKEQIKMVWKALDNATYP